MSAISSPEIYGSLSVVGRQEENWDDGISFCRNAAVQIDFRPYDCYMNGQSKQDNRVIVF